jgi:hypothetical protein
MYGIALEGMAQASQTFGRPEMPGYMKRAADWLYANPKELGAQQGVSIMLTPGLAYVGEGMGERKYWDDALKSFRRYTEEGQVTDRLKLFAQLYRNSQRFLWRLSVESPVRWGEETPDRPASRSITQSPVP